MMFSEVLAVRLLLVTVGRSVGEVWRCCWTHELPFWGSTPELSFLVLHHRSLDLWHYTTRFSAFVSNDPCCILLAPASVTARLWLPNWCRLDTQYKCLRQPYPAKTKVTAWTGPKCTALHSFPLSGVTLRSPIQKVHLPRTNDFGKRETQRKAYTFITTTVYAAESALKVTLVGPARSSSWGPAWRRGLGAGITISLIFHSTSVFFISC